MWSRFPSGVAGHTGRRGSRRANSCVMSRLGRSSALAKNGANSGFKLRGSYWLRRLVIFEFTKDCTGFAVGSRSWIRVEKAFGLRAPSAVDIDNGRGKKPVGEREA